MKGNFEILISKLTIAKASVFGQGANHGTGLSGSHLEQKNQEEMHALQIGSI